jgi:predicted nucleic acid-binding protein
MTTPIRLFLHRIYLDTNILISAILESDAQWIGTHSKEYQREKKRIDSARDIFFLWENRSDSLKTSTFAIGEFIGTGNSKFGIPFKEMLKIVDNKILGRCKLCQGENLQYNRQLVPEKMQKEWRLIEIIGKAQRGMEYRYILTLNMGIVRAVLGSGAVSEQINFENLVMEKILSYSAPGFEIMLFQRVSELANKYGLGLADAFHVFYAHGQAE